MTCCNDTIIDSEIVLKPLTTTICSYLILSIIFNKTGFFFRQSSALKQRKQSYRKNFGSIWEQHTIQQHKKLFSTAMETWCKSMRGAGYCRRYKIFMTTNRWFAHWLYLVICLHSLLPIKEGSYFPYIKLKVLNHWVIILVSLIMGGCFFNAFLTCLHFWYQTKKERNPSLEILQRNCKSSSCWK